MKKDIKSLTLKELQDEMGMIGEAKFRAGQIYRWLHVKYADDFSDMTDLSENLRTKLKENYDIVGVRQVKKLVSKEDNTTKYLFEIENNYIIESVFMRYSYGNTMCVSTQAGCRMGCAFCASTIGGVEKSLSPSEMLSQIYEAEKDMGEKVSHVVLMGSGEPLDNYENVIRFLRLVSAPEGIGVSLRNVSVSTCGLVPRIYDLARENLPITLSISLHAPTDEARQRIMPIAKTYSLEELLRACRDYVKAVGRRIVFEYALIEGVNTSLADADRLADLVRGLLCHVNLIPLNDVPERNLAAPGQKGIEAFQRRLEARGVSVTRRREMGADIQGACGQLRRKHLSQEGTLA